MAVKSFHSWLFEDSYVSNIEHETLTNTDYRRVIFTGPHTQLVLMSLQPKQEIGMETHGTHDQFIRIERGDGEAIIAGKTSKLKDGTALVIPSGTKHNIINTSATRTLKLYTLYSPPEHPDNKVEPTKED